MSLPHELTTEDRRELLRIARITLREYLRSGRIPPGAPHRASLQQKAGVFVTLRQQGVPRGCFGTLSDDQPLYRAVQEMAAGAATRDPGFERLRPEELPGVSIEVSVLSDREPVPATQAVARIQIGRHGLQVQHGDRRGLLLPQAALEHAWDGAELLRQACRKAGLQEEAWRLPDAVVELFQADAFSESQLPPG